MARAMEVRAARRKGLENILMVDELFGVLCRGVYYV